VEAGRADDAGGAAAPMVILHCFHQNFEVNGDLGILFAG
jgi:hypothetical protein